MRYKRGELVQDIAPMVVVVAAIVGAAAFLTIGWIALIFLDFGRTAGTGFMNSQPVVLTTIFAPVILPLLAWAALRLKRHLLALMLALPSLAPSFLLLSLYFRN